MIVEFGVEQDVECEEDETNEHLLERNSLPAMRDKALGEMVRLVHRVFLSALGIRVKGASNECLILVICQVGTHKESREVETI